MKNLNLISLLFVAVLSISCSSNNAADCSASQFNSEVTAAAQQLSLAAQAWSTNPAACTEFVAAANNYLNAIESFDGCGAIAQSDYDAQIDAARAAINSLPACETGNQQ